MSVSLSNLIVDLFFIHATLATGIIAWYFLTKKKKVFKDFGWGMLGYSLGLASWTVLVITRPNDLKPLIIIGVIPFLLGALAYARAASDKFPINGNTLLTLVLLLIVATFVTRTYFYPSDPYFSSKGLLFFGLAPVPIALYIATISVTFLPAIRAVIASMKDKVMKSVLGVGLTVLYVCSIILISSNDNTLLLINGVVITVSLLVIWVKILGSPNKI